MDYEKITLERDGILTPVDERIIYDKLMACKGIESVKIIYRAGTVATEYDPEYASEEAIDDFLTELGYPKGTGLFGFWLDILSAVMVVVLYIFLPKLFTRLGWSLAGLSPWLGVPGVILGVAFVGVGLKMWGVAPFLAKIKLNFADGIPKHYKGFPYKMITLLLTEAGLLMFFASMSLFGF